MKISRQVPPLLRELMEAALEAVDPGAGILDRHLPEPRGYQRICVLALGKAAASMAQAVERRWSVELDGVAVTRQGYERDLTRIELRVGTHPLPSRGSLAGGEALLRRASSLRDGDLALVLLSGGASALACVPIDGVEIEDIARWTRALLRGGATVHEINTVRRHLCQLKGGGLAAAAWPAHVVTLAISDVAGDAPESIGSGPTLPDPTTTRDAREVFAKYLSEPAPGFRDTVKSTDVRLSKTTFQLVDRL